MSYVGRWTIVARRQMSRYRLFRLEEHHGCVFSGEVLKCQWSLVAMPINAHCNASGDSFSKLLQKRTL